jgi:hypothetical protein
MKITRKGFGQVEPNHLSAQRNGQIYAQLPLDSEYEGVLENGQFMKYDYANGKVGLAGDVNEYFLVYNEVKVYDERETYKDFAMKKEDYVGGEIYPRLFKTNIGDIYTTNCVGLANTDKNASVTYDTDLAVGDKLVVNTSTGYLVKSNSDADMIWQIVKIYTMPDGQAGIKIQRIK